MNLPTPGNFLEDEDLMKILRVNQNLSNLTSEIDSELSRMRDTQLTRSRQHFCLLASAVVRVQSSLGAPS